METGGLDDGLDALKEALAAADEHGNRHYEAETHRPKGELLLKQNDSNTAEIQNSFKRAIEIAHKQSAKSWELRATISLARLLSKQGHHDEARWLAWHRAIEALPAKLQPRPLGFADPLEEPSNQSSIESVSARLHLDNDRSDEIDVFPIASQRTECARFQ
jgi:hypothetical protein